MLITVISDASLCHQTGIAGYGYWVKSDRGGTRGSGVLQGHNSSSVLAEMRALMNGLHASLKKGLAIKGDKVLLQTDCEGVITTFTGKRKRFLNVQELEAVEYFKEIIDKFELAYEFRHVKGHTKREGGRYLAQAWCDQKAGDAMRNARRKQRIEAANAKPR